MSGPRLPTDTSRAVSARFTCEAPLSKGLFEAESRTSFWSATLQKKISRPKSKHAEQRKVDSFPQTQQGLEGATPGAAGIALCVSARASSMAW